MYVGGLAVLGAFGVDSPFTAGTLVAFALYIERFLQPDSRSGATLQQLSSGDGILRTYL
jgi:ABC-type multidrug transport system fused ATPase/permease subunit